MKTEHAILAAAFLSQGWTEGVGTGRARVFHKGDLTRAVWPSGIIRNGASSTGTRVISQQEKAMWLAFGEVVSYAPAEQEDTHDDG